MQILTIANSGTPTPQLLLQLMQKRSSHSFPRFPRRYLWQKNTSAEARPVVDALLLIRPESDRKSLSVIKRAELTAPANGPYNTPAIKSDWQAPIYHASGS